MFRNQSKRGSQSSYLTFSPEPRRGVRSVSRRRSPENQSSPTNHLLSVEERQILERNITKSKFKIKKINMKIEQIVTDAMSGIHYIVNSNGGLNGVSSSRVKIPSNKHKNGCC
jgi:hypothetical protein